MATTIPQNTQTMYASPSQTGGWVVSPEGQSYYLEPGRDDNYMAPAGINRSITNQFIGADEYSALAAAQRALLMPQANSVANFQAQTAQALTGTGQRYTQAYRQGFMPMARDLAAEAGGATGEDALRAAGENAQAGVAQQFANRRAATERRMRPYGGVKDARYGVEMDAAEQAAKADASNDAYDGALDRGFQKQMTAAGFGANFGQAGLQQRIGAGNTMQRSLATSTLPGDELRANARAYSGVNLGAGDIYGSLYGTRVQSELSRKLQQERRYQQENAENDRIMGGLLGIATMGISKA